MSSAVLDDDQCWRAMQARDRRFDGRFFIGVRTTGIYCRPSCPTPTQPKRSNIDFHPSAAAAQIAGLRACKRCRPDTIGSSYWNSRDDLVGRAVRLIDEGTIDRVGVAGLATQLHVSERHLTRVLTEHLGAGPLALARSQRASIARTLIEATQLAFGEIAFAAGFSSIRQFNETMQDLYALSPTVLRASATPLDEFTRDDAATLATTLSLRLTTRPPFDRRSLFDFLANRCVDGVEQGHLDEERSRKRASADQFFYARSLLLPGGPAVFSIRPVAAPLTGVHSTLEHLSLAVSVSTLSDLSNVVARVRRLFDLDTDATAVEEVLHTDPHLAALSRKYAGRRAPGAVDPHEIGIRAVLGQQVSVAAARTLASRLATRHGAALPPQLRLADAPKVTHLFPTMERLAALDPADIGIPGSRAKALINLADVLASGNIDLTIGTDRDDARRALVALPGIGRWTAGYVTMRGLSDPDMLLDDDLAVLNGAKALGIASTSKELAAWGEKFSPFRSYVTQLLWAACPPPTSKRRTK